MDELKTLRELAEKATPGPWYDTDHSDDPVDEPRVFTEDGMQIAHVYEDWTLAYPRERRLATQRANQQYIAAASPSVVLALLDRLEADEDLLRQAAERLQWAAASDAAGDYSLSYEIKDHFAQLDKQEKQ